MVTASSPAACGASLKLLWSAPRTIRASRRNGRAARIGTQRHHFNPRASLPDFLAVAAQATKEWGITRRPVLGALVAFRNTLLDQRDRLAVG